MLSHLFFEEAAYRKDIGLSIIGGPEGLADMHLTLAEIKESRHNGHISLMRNLPETSFPTLSSLTCTFGSNSNSQSLPFGKLTNGGTNHVIMTVATVDGNAA